MSDSSQTDTYSLDPFLSRRDGAAEIYLIRHADAFPDNTDELALDTSYDSRPLSSIGQEQARKLAQHLLPIKFDAIYSSPLPRTRETAAPLAQLQNLLIEFVDDLREIELHTSSVATVENKKQSLREQVDEAVRIAAQAGSWSVVPGAEQGATFRTRVVAAIDAIAERHLGKKVAVVSHGAAINIYVADLLGLQKDFFFPVANTSVSIIRVKGINRVLVSLNDICHLR